MTYEMDKSNIMTLAENIRHSISHSMFGSFANNMGKSTESVYNYVALS
jgi:shikimate 5-dehydrogenase